MQPNPDVIVVGGGIVGAGIAYELACRGAAVTLIERGRIAREASWASAGIVSPPSRMDQRPERIELGRRSIARYPSLVDELERQSGLSLEYRRSGEWTIAVDADRAASERKRADWQRSHGFAIEERSPVEALAAEPALPSTTVAAWYTPQGATVTVARVAQAYAASAARLGATIREETPVVKVLVDGHRVTGVRLADGDLRTDVVVLATGAWTRFLGDQLGVKLPTKPVKGQLIAFSGAPLQPRGVISGHGGYVRPRVDGSVIVAATEEDVGFDRRVTGDGVAWLLELARTLCPALLSDELIDSWTGLRPGSETGDPLLGPVPPYDGLWVAAGHFRTGAKEGPATAELVAASIVDGQVDPLLRPFAPPHDGPRR